MSRPAFRTLIPYTLGVFIARFLPIPLLWMWLIVPISLAGSLVLRRYRKRNHHTPDHRGSHLFSHALLLLAIFSCGMLRLRMALTSPIPAGFYDQQVRFSGRMTYQPDRGELWEAGYAIGTIRPMAMPDRAVKTKLLIRFREPVPLHYGDQLDIKGELRQPNSQRNPGGFDYRFYLARRQVFGMLYPNRNQNLEPTHRSGFPPLRWAEGTRRHLESVIDDAYQEIPEHAQILKGMLLGQRDVLPEKTLNAFQNSGVMHILAVSGLHIGLIVAFWFIGFSLLRPPRKPMPLKLVCLLTIVPIIIFACLIGFRPSVVRASLIAILFLIGILIDRDVDLINLLAFVALLLLLINPAQLWDVGFQLSFAAVGAIVYFLPKWNSFTARLLPNLTNPSAAQHTSFSRLRVLWRSMIKWLLIAFGVTLSAQLGTSLIIAQHFYRAYPLSLITNLFAVGLATFIVSITLASTILGLIWLPSAAMLVAANHLLLTLFLKIIEFFGSQPGAVIRTGSPTVGWAVVYIAGCLAITHWRWVWTARKPSVLIGMAVLAIWMGDVARKDRSDLLEITFLDVGQGDAAFVQFPDGKTMLIDGGLNARGYDNGERVLEPFLRHEGVRRLDLLVLSHPDNDHGGGLAHILHEFSVQRMLGVPHQELASSTHQILHEIVDAKAIPHALGHAGEIDLTPTARIELLYPQNEASINLMDEDINNDSLVLKVTYGQIRILFTGDIEEETERILMEQGSNLRAEILKTPHHGSDTSSSEPFLDAVNPRYAIFSLGQRNRYGFPSEGVVERYRKRGCRVLRTDQLGAIRLRTDGRQCWIMHSDGTGSSE